MTSATFNGSVKFEDQGLQASGALGEYDPAKGTLRLSGTDAGGAPRVADAQIEIEGEAIDVTLQGRRMAARGNVRTILRAGSAKNRLPGLLQQGQPANVNANALEYDGDAGKATLHRRRGALAGRDGDSRQYDRAGSNPRGPGGDRRRAVDGRT